MSNRFFTRTVFTSLFMTTLLGITPDNLTAQLTPNDFVLLSGPNGTGTTLIGSSITVNGGAVGAYKLIQTTGNVSFNGTNLYSADKIILTNSNIVSGNIASAGNYPNLPLTTGTILSIGSSTSISGNIDVYGNVVVGGGTVTGRVRLPAPSVFNGNTNYTYSGPTPTGGVEYGTPLIPVLPVLGGESPIPAPLVNPPTITNNQTYGPGSYGNINYGGNRTLTLDGPGTYYFNSFHWSGNSNKLVFNFKNQPGDFTIYVYGEADFGKINASITNGGSAARIALEARGTGNAFVIANGSAGTGAKWLGSVFAPNGSIIIGSGTGSSLLTGTFASNYSISIQSGVTVVYSAPCPKSKFVNAGVDRPLAFTNLDALVATSTLPGTSFSWQATNGGVIASGANTAQANISAAGTYIVTGTTAAGCTSKDTVVISARVLNLIGAELLSIYQNRTIPNLSSTPFFGIQNGYVLIDVIVNAGYYSDVLATLQTSPYGLRPPYFNAIPPDLTFHNGQSNLIITGQFPIENLITLDNFNIDAGVNKINFVRTYYIPVSNSGLVTTAGDTTIRTWLVRSGYDVKGDGIKIGVISDSYATIRSGSTNPVTQTAAQDVLAGDLPGDTTFSWSTPSHVVNPFGFTNNVHVLQDFPIQRSDEGRAMLQIIHDIAPASELYFRTGFFTNTDFAKGIKELKAAGCNIIVDDMTYMNEPFLKDGVVAKTVDTVVGQGVTYFSAAGNFDKQSYEKDANFVDAASIGFGGGRKAHNFGNNDLFQQIKLRPGNYVFVLQWLDGIHSAGETGTLYDLDIYISQSTNGTGLIGFNRNNLLGDPIEFIPIKIVGNSETDTVSKTYNVLIINNTTTGNPERVKFIAFKRDAAANIQFMNHVEGTSTIVGQANAMGQSYPGSIGAIAVGAARFDKAKPYFNLPPQIETYSSTGGTKTGGVIRLKPDIVAPDGVEITVGIGPDYNVPAFNGYPNFFGTSAAAPHAAAAAALIMEGRKKFLGQNTVTPAQMKSLLQTTATDMETPGFDLISGAGLINIDMTMRSFAAPRPHIDSLVVPLVLPLDRRQIIPGDTVFTVTIRGNNFRPNSVAYFRDSALASTVVLDTVNGIATAIIPKFEGNPPIRMYTPPYATTNGTDGGFSNNAYFFENRVVVKAVSYNLKYGDPLPTVFDTIITINDTLLQNSRYTPADLGFDKDSLHIQVSAPDFSDVGTYLIRVFRNFTPGNSADSALLRRFSYKFIDGTLTIGKLPVKVVPDDITFVYGQPVPNITYKYYDSNNVLITNPVLLHLLDSSHRIALPDNVLGVINGYGTSGLTDADLQNMSGMSTFQAIKNSRRMQVVNGEWQPASNPVPFDAQYLVDVSAQSVKNFRTASLTDDILVPAYPGIHSRAMIKATALINGTAQSGPANNLVHLVNGQLVPVVNGTTNGLVPIVNGQLVQMVNGAPLQLVNGQLKPVVNGQLVQLVNGQWVTLNGEVVSNGALVQIVNGQLVQLVNGQLVPLVNGQLVQLVNGLSSSPLQMSNGQLVQLVNGQLVPLVNGQLVQLVNGVLEQLVNGVLVPLVNGQLVQLVNGQLVQLVNGQLVQLVNGNKFDVGTTNGLVQIVNGQLVQLVNGQLVPLVNGVLVQLVNGQLVPLVNSYGADAGGNENAAVIIDSDDVELQDGFIGAMFSTNIITGLDVGTQTIMSGTLGNSNFATTYGLGHATVTNAECLQIHTPFKNFGNTTQHPTSLWLNVVTKVSGQLNAPNDSLIFKNASTTFNFINSTPVIDNFPLPVGAIVADAAVTAPVTHFDFVKNMWVTRVPVGFASTSDIFVTGGIINSETGFQKMNGNTNTVVRGKFYCTKNFSDQWTFAIAAYQPQFTYETVGDTGQVASINGDYRAATPLPILDFLVQGASGGGGNNYTGSKASFQAFSACVIAGSDQPRSAITSVSAQEQGLPMQAEMMIHPNPASEMLNLSFVPLQTGISRVELFSISGSKIFEIDYGVCEAGNRYSKKINVSKLVNGVYLVRLSNAGNVTNKKIVIAR